MQSSQRTVPAVAPRLLRTEIQHRLYIGKEQGDALPIGTPVPDAGISSIMLHGKPKSLKSTGRVKKSLTTALMFGRFFVNLHTWIQALGLALVNHRGDCRQSDWVRVQTYEGVNRRPSSTFKLGRLKRDEDDRMIAPASVAYSRRHSRRIYTLHGVGLLFYPSLRQAKARM